MSGIIYHNDESLSVSLERQHIECDVYPDHGSKGYNMQYDTALTDIGSGDPLLSLEFHYITDYTVGIGGYSDAVVMKRTDVLGRVVTIEFLPDSVGKNRVTHSYLSSTVSSTFDLTTEYARALLSGRDNGYLFYEFPQEVDNG